MVEMGLCDVFGSWQILTRLSPVGLQMDSLLRLIEVKGTFHLPYNDVKAQSEAKEKSVQLGELMHCSYTKTRRNRLFLATTTFYKTYHGGCFSDHPLAVDDFTETDAEKLRARGDPNPYSACQVLELGIGAVTSSGRG